MHNIKNTTNIHLLTIKKHINIFLITKKLTNNILKINIKYIYINIILTIKNNKSKIIKLYYSKKIIHSNINIYY